MVRRVNSYRLKALIVTSLLIIMAPSMSSHAKDDKKLEGHKWTITAVGEHKGPHLGFIIFENGQLEGQSTCNSYSAVYSTKEQNNIEIYRLGVTQLQCKVGNKMEVEGTYLEGLEAANRYEIKDDHLIIYDKKDSKVAEFE